MGDGRRVDRRARSRSCGCDRQGESVTCQESPGTSEGRQGYKVSEEVVPVAGPSGRGFLVISRRGRAENVGGEALDPGVQLLIGATKRRATEDGFETRWSCSLLIGPDIATVPVGRLAGAPTGQASAPLDEVRVQTISMETRGPLLRPRIGRATLKTGAKQPQATRSESRISAALFGFWLVGERLLATS